MVGGCFYKITHGRRLRSGLIVSGGLFTTTQTGDDDTDKRRLGQTGVDTDDWQYRRTTTRTVSAILAASTKFGVKLHLFKMSQLMLK